MRSEAQKKANAKYQKNNVTQISIKLINSTDSDIINKLNKVPNKAGYVKTLIRNDINNETKSNK